jgi:hypothetical protein
MFTVANPKGREDLVIWQEFRHIEAKDRVGAIGSQSPF